MQALLKTLYDIALLRKGPDAIPRSLILLVMAAALWVFASLASLALGEQHDEAEFAINQFTVLIALVAYAAIIVVTGYGPRVLQAVSAVLGCGALISLLAIAELVLLVPFLGKTPAGIVAWLTTLWSVPVEGHIMARAINAHWYVGIVIAIAVFVLQHAVYGTMTASS